MTSPVLKSDAYKFSHMLLYPQGTQTVYETLTPRANSFFPWSDKMTAFGYRLFLARLEEDFNDNFFGLAWADVDAEVRPAIAESLGSESVDAIMTKFKELHDLGFLPIKVATLPEGTLVPMQVPVMTIENTRPEFFWLPGYLETLLLSETFVTSTVASVARIFRQIGQKYANLSADDDGYLDFQFHDFSQRGQHGNDASVLSGIAHLTSFKGTDIIQAPAEVHKYYAEDNTAFIGGSVLATEHSVMESVYADVSSSADAQFGFAGDTQVLTPNGWTSLLEVDDTDEVFQVSDSGFGSFAPIIKLNKSHYEGEMIHWTGHDDKINSLVSPNNYISVVRPSRTNRNEEKLEKIQSKVANPGNRYTYQRTSAPKAGGIDHLTPLDQLKIAFQADGAKTQRYKALVFSFAKERKIERLTGILEKLGYNYRTTPAPSSANQPNRKDQTRFSIDLPSDVVVENDLSWIDLSNKSHIWLKEFLTEISQWDSSNTHTHFQYFSNNPLNVDIVERAAVMAGYYVRQGLTTYDNPNHKTTYYVTVVYNNILHGQLRQKESIEYADEIVSISVPSGNILTKYGSATMVLPDNTDNYREQSYINQLESYRALIKTTPNGILSIVSDTYDYWEVVNQVLPALKDDVLARNGKVVIRPDSDTELVSHTLDMLVLTTNGWEPFGDREGELIVLPTGNIITKDGLAPFMPATDDIDATSELILATMYSMADTFGVTVNSKGYMVLNSHIGILHGEGVTLDTIDGYLETITKAGFSAENIVFGVGAYVYSVLVSRDSFGQALKATSVTINGTEKAVFKNPKTASEGFKKSRKGRVQVVREQGELVVHDGFTAETIPDDNLLQVVYDEGFVSDKPSFDELRAIIKRS